MPGSRKASDEERIILDNPEEAKALEEKLRQGFSLNTTPWSTNPESNEGASKRSMPKKQNLKIGKLAIFVLLLMAAFSVLFYLYPALNLPRSQVQTQDLFPSQTPCTTSTTSNPNGTTSAENPCADFKLLVPNSLLGLKLLRVTFPTIQFAEIAYGAANLTGYYNENATFLVSLLPDSSSAIQLFTGVRANETGRLSQNAIIIENTSSSFSYKMLNTTHSHSFFFMLGRSNSAVCTILGRNIPDVLSNNSSTSENLGKCFSFIQT